MDVLQVLKVLAQVGGSFSKAVQILGISGRAGSALQGKAYKGASSFNKTHINQASKL
jgi:hypothetical protein